MKKTLRISIDFETMGKNAEEVYDDFREYLKQCVSSGDLTAFDFYEEMDD